MSNQNPRYHWSYYNAVEVDPKVDVSHVKVLDKIGNKLDIGDKVAIVMKDRSHDLIFRVIQSIKYYHPNRIDTLLPWGDPNRDIVDYDPQRIGAELIFDRKVTRFSDEVLKVVIEP